MKFHAERYQKGWAKISRQIREERGNKCEECGAAYNLHPALGETLVILTCAHLDHDPSNNAPENIKVFCRPCHLRYDRFDNARAAAETMKKKKDAQRV